MPIVLLECLSALIIMSLYTLVVLAVILRCPIESKRSKTIKFTLSTTFVLCTVCLMAGIIEVYQIIVR